MIIISATPTGISREGSRISESDHYDPRLYCTDCRVEILRGEPKHDIIGRTPGVEQVVADCTASS